MEAAKQTVSRSERRKIRTRAKLVEAAYEIMSRQGVDATTIAEITEQADVGFGTFYNYFDSKEDLAAQVLDCVIDDMGRRNDAATASMKGRSPAAVQAVSIRLTMREMMTNPMWKWWFQRPDLLARRLRSGFYRYGARDLRMGQEAGRYNIAPGDVEMVWSEQMWMLAGGLAEILERGDPAFNETVLIETIMRAMGVTAARARELSQLELPDYPPSDIDFSFVLEEE